MSKQSIEAEFRQKVSEKVSLEAEGLDRYRVDTPFTFNDGDHFVILLKREASRWILSDEGHTFMHLTYSLNESDLRKGTRATIIGNTLSSFFVDDREGELVLTVPDERFGDALFSFVQALMKVSDVTFLTRERVRSAFLDDFRVFMEAEVPENRREFGWHDPVRDPEGKYTVSCRINSMPRPLLVFALAHDDKVRDATIAMHWFERQPSADARSAARAAMAGRSMAIFEDQEQINRKVLARFSDVCDKQFSNLATNKDRIHKYIQDVLAQNPA